MAERGIGERLRNAREARGLSLDEIEAATRIRRRYLEALEAEAFGELPGSAYARGFLRVYASYLGLPADELIGLYPDLRAGPAVSHGAPVEVRITPATPPSRARRVITAIAAVLILGLVGLAYMLYGQIRQFAQTPPAAAPVAPSPARVGPGTPGRTLAARQSPSSQPAQPPQQPAAAPPAPPAPAAPAPTAPGALTSPLRMVVVATDRSWVRTVADGVTVYEGFLSAGDRQVWEARRQITIRIGNASALDVTVNGHALGRLGKPGDVVDRTFIATASTPARP